MSTRASGGARRFLVHGLFGAGLILAVAACGGAAATSAPGGSAAPAATADAPSDGGAPSDAGASAALTGGPCDRVSAADVQQAFGGTVGSGVEDDQNGCAYDVSGALKAGTVTPPNPYLVRVSWQDEFTALADAKAVFGDDIKTVDGLGTVAYFGAGAIHAQVPEGDQIITAIGLGDLNPDLVHQSMVDLEKILLAKS